MPSYSARPTQVNAQGYSGKFMPARPQAGGGGGFGSGHNRSVKAHTLSPYGLAHLTGRVTRLGVEESAGVVVCFHPAIQLKLE